jgi:hypothetical protein
MIRQFVSQEVCLKCQGCCRFKQEDSVWSPILFNEEIELLLKEGLSPALISPHKKIRVASFSKEDIFICSLFNTEENKCKIYNFRPLECQLYPFVINRKNDKIFLSLDSQCSPAAGKQETRELKEYAQYLAGLLNSPRYAEILKNNFQIIQTYPDVLDLCALQI